jgi:hypothetical protein
MGHMPNVKILETQESEGYLHNLSDHQVFKHDIILIMVAYKQFVKKYLIYNQTERIGIHTSVKYLIFVKLGCHIQVCNQ